MSSFKQAASSGGAMENMVREARFAAAQFGKDTPEYWAYLKTKGIRKDQKNLLEKGIGFAGDVAKVALPVASFIPGVNLGVGALAGLGALAGAAGTANDAGSPSLSKMAGGAAKWGAIGGASGALSGAVKGGTAAAGIGGGGGGAATAAGEAAKAAGGMGGIGGLLKKAGGFALKNPDLLLAGAAAYGTAKQQGRADDLNRKAIATAEKRAQEFAPIRADLLQRLSTLGQAQPVPVSLRDMGNPYSRA